MEETGSGSLFVLQALGLESFLVCDVHDAAQHIKCACIYDIQQTLTKLNTIIGEPNLSIQLAKCRAAGEAKGVARSTIICGLILPLLNSFKTKR